MCIYINTEYWLERSFKLLANLAAARNLVHYILDMPKFLNNEITINSCKLLKMFQRFLMLNSNEPVKPGDLQK